MSYAAHVTPHFVEKITKRDLKRKVEELEKELEAARAANEVLRARVEKLEGERDSAVTSRNIALDLLLQEERVNQELRVGITQLERKNLLLMIENEQLDPLFSSGHVP
jgi:hypothetical protein